MSQISSYGGVEEIGGNKFLLQTTEAKVYFDFGQSFDYGEDFFFEWLEPRLITRPGADRF
jgi:ribonuclease J